MWNSEFMIVALIVSLLFGVLMPLAGGPAVYKRLSSSGDALSHSALAGVAIGLAAGLNTLWTSLAACFVSLLLLELIRNRFSKYAEVGVSVVFALAVGLAGILSSYTNASSFDSYLFGSVLLVSKEELYLTIALTVIALLFSIFFMPQIFASLYSSSESKVVKIPTRLINFFEDLLLALTIALGSKIVGSLVVSSMVVLPTAMALQLKKGYKVTMWVSEVFSVLMMGAGLILSYYADWKPGATIVTLAVLVLLLFVAGREIYDRLVTRKKSEKQHVSNQNNLSDK